MHEHHAVTTWVAEQMFLKAPLSVESIVNPVWGSLRGGDCGVWLSEGRGEVGGGLSVTRGICEEDSSVEWRCPRDGVPGEWPMDLSHGCVWAPAVYTEGHTEMSIRSGSDFGWPQSSEAGEHGDEAQCSAAGTRPKDREPGCLRGVGRMRGTGDK